MYKLQLCALLVLYVICIANKREVGVKKNKIRMGCSLTWAWGAAGCRVAWPSPVPSGSCARAWPAGSPRARTPSART
jgi:hypothetical protein